MLKLTSILLCFVAFGTCVVQGDTVSLDITTDSFNTAAVRTEATPDAAGIVGSGDAFYDTTLSAASGDNNPQLAGAFPTLTGTGLSGNVYNFAPNSGEDSLQGDGTLTLVTPTANLSTLFILGTSADGDGTATATLNFAGGTTFTTSTITFPDWGGNNGDINGLGRVNGSNQQDAGLQFALFDPSVSIPIADQSLTLDSILFSNVSGNVAIFAVNGTAVTVPEPSAFALLTLGLGVTALIMTLRNRRQTLRMRAWWVFSSDIVLSGLWFRRRSRRV